MSEQLLKEILGELKTINQRVGSLEDGQKELKSDVSDLKKGQQRLETGQQKLETRMDSLETGQVRLETRMENEVIDKVRTLFDAHSVHMDYFASLRDSQSRIEEKLNILVNRAIGQDQKLDEHEREIRLLRIEK